MNEVDARDKLWKMIKDIRFAMLTTRHGNGHLHTRPMRTQNTGLGGDDKGRGQPQAAGAARRARPRADALIRRAQSVTSPTNGDDLAGDDGVVRPFIGERRADHRGSPSPG